MKIKIGRTIYKVEFYHYRYNGGMINNFGKWRSYAGKTVCHIKKNKTVTVVEGFAYQNPQDEYKKETGRKLSLARAIQDFDKSDRKIFWEAYLSRGRGEYIK